MRQAVLGAMNASLAHRGPDGEGLWISPDRRIGLAHRRLAIVDLSAAAAQPMADADGRVWVTYNGEIYNHLDLRRALEQTGARFRTDHADTEVLIHGFKAWGMEGLLARLEGMFAFGLWDGADRRLYLARDRVGIKPLYFAAVEGEFRFASEIKAILADPAVPRAVEPAAVNHYLSFMVAPAPLTMFRGIYKLPAGHLLTVDGQGRLAARRYWEALPGAGSAGDEAAGLSDAVREDFYAAGIRRRLEASVAKHMMADVPVGVFLSGGVDSSAVVAMASRQSGRPLDTFTVGFTDHPQFNELDHARRVASAFGTRHHEVLIGETDMLGYLDALVHSQDEPIADWVCVPLYFVSRLAKEAGVTVVQVGEGSDELFCGYDSWMSYLRVQKRFWAPYRRAVPAALRRAIAAGAAALARGTARADRMAEVLIRAGRHRELFWSGANAFWTVHKQRYLGAPIGAGGDAWPPLEEAGFDLAGLASADSGALIDGLARHIDREWPGADPLARMTAGEFRLRLPELLLMRVDKIAMSTSVEARVPFLDHRLVEFGMAIPMAAKVRGGIPKRLLKRALADLLPAEILGRRKMGFGAPMAEWLRGPFGRRAEAAVLGSRLIGGGDLPFDREAIAQNFRAHREGRRDEAVRLWTLFNLAAWHDHWIAGQGAGAAAPVLEGTTAS